MVAMYSFRRRLTPKVHLCLQTAVDFHGVPRFAIVILLARPAPRGARTALTPRLSRRGRGPLAARAAAAFAPPRPRAWPSRPGTASVRAWAAARRGARPARPARRPARRW